MLSKLFSHSLSENQKANRRISLFTAIVLCVMFLGVFGIYPTNALSIMSPLTGVIMWFALFCVFFCFINLFNKDRVPGVKEFNNKDYLNLLFTVGMGVGIMIFGFNEAPQLSQYKDVHNAIGLTLNHWTIMPWCMYAMFTIFEIYDLKYKILPKWLESVKSYLYSLSMMLGIGTSFALGVIMISKSMNIIWGYDIPSYSLVILLGALVTISLLRGIHKGMAMFAKLSMYLLYIFIVILVIIAPKDTLTQSVSAVGSLFTDFFYNNIYSGRAVQNDWTNFYWVWWLK